MEDGGEDWNPDSHKFSRGQWAGRILKTIEEEGSRRGDAEDAERTAEKNPDGSVGMTLPIFLGSGALDV
jgi:hypothetical protein